MPEQMTDSLCRQATRYTDGHRSRNWNYGDLQYHHHSAAMWLLDVLPPWLLLPTNCMDFCMPARECMVLLKLITLSQLVGREGWTIVLMCLMCKSMPFSTRKNKDEIQSRVPQWEDVFIKNESLCWVLIVSIFHIVHKSWAGTCINSDFY